MLPERSEIRRDRRTLERFANFYYKTKQAFLFEKKKKFVLWKLVLLNTIEYNRIQWTIYRRGIAHKPLLWLVVDGRSIVGQTAAQAVAQTAAIQSSATVQRISHTWP